MTFSEIGLVNNKSGRVLAARDAINVTVSDAETVTLHYSIVVDCSADGGVMAQFNQLLHRHTAETSREVVDN